MNPIFRKILFRFLTLFFVFFVPILIFAILGFDFSFRQKKIINSMDITIETLPRNAEITSFGQNIGATPSSLKIEAGNFVDLELKKEDFLLERFGFMGPKNENINIRLSNLQLLSTKNQTIAALQEPSKNQATGSPVRENLTLLPEIILWTTNLKTPPKINVSKTGQQSEISQTSQNSSNSGKNMVDYSTNNSTNSATILQNKQDLVSSDFTKNSSTNSQSSLETSNPNQQKSQNNNENNNDKNEKSDQSLEQNSKQIVWAQNFTLTGLIGNSKKVSKIAERNFKSGGNWQNIGKSYWNKDTNWLLFAQDNDWNLLDLSLFVSFGSIKSLVQNSNFQFLVLDNSGNLWLWNLNNFDNLKNSQNNSSSSNNSNNSTNSSKLIGNNSSNSSQNQISNSQINQLSQSSSQKSSQNSSQNKTNFDQNSDLQVDLQTNSQNNLQSFFQLEFLESSVCQMSFLENSKTIWIIQNAQILRLESAKIENWNLENNFFAINSKFNSVNSSKCAKMEVKSFLQGYVFLVDQTLWFLPDSDRQNWLVLANLVDSFETFEENLFWQNGKNLYNYNSITKLEKYLGQIELGDLQNTNLQNGQNKQNYQNTKMFYDPNWRRLIIYNRIDNLKNNKNDLTNFSSNSNSQNEQNRQNSQNTTINSTNLNNFSQNQVWSVWFDKLNPNSQNIIFYPKIWLNKNCLNKIQDQLQFCLDNENLIIYGNFNLF